MRKTARQRPLPAHADAASFADWGPKSMLTPAITGFGTGFSLILVIGAQNVFVLRQGLMNLHVFWVCLICALSDAILIGLGVAGAGSIGSAHPSALIALTWAGAAFLIAYGALNMRRAIGPRALHVAGNGSGSLRGAIVTCFALTWLNPHVYIDTVGVIGAVSTGFSVPDDRFAYGVGAIFASFVFFFSLGYAARRFALVFAQPRAWAFLDIGTAIVMWVIATMLILNSVAH